MSQTAGLENIHSGIEESARLRDTPCSRDKVWPVLTAFQESMLLSETAA
jgi:hypothetical protein